MPTTSHQYQYVFPITLTPLQRLTTAIMTEADSTFIVEKMYALNGGTFTVQFKDSALNYQWSNLPVNNDNIFGTLEFPAKLIDPIPLPPSTEIQAVLEDTSGAPNTIEIVFEGYRIYSGVSTPSRRFYQYINNIALPPSDVITDNLQINGDSDFLVKKLIASKDAEASIKLASTEMSGRYLSSQFVSLSNLFGRALLPNILTHPLKLGKLTLLQYELRNQVALANNVQLCFEGVKLWGNQIGS